AVFLGSLRSGKSEKLAVQGEGIAHGETLYADLRCGSCHSGQGTENADAGLMSLEHVSDKFRPEALADYLLNPQTNYRWNRMPDFRLTSAEAAALAQFLRGGDERPLAKPSEEVIQ